MAIVDLVMPQMGESVMEGTILKWFKSPGDTIEQDDILLEVGTDKVDTEIPAPFNGKFIEILFKEGDIVAIGTTIATIEVTDQEAKNIQQPVKKEVVPEKKTSKEVNTTVTKPSKKKAIVTSNRFYSPLVLNIASRENISMQELEQIPGSGKDGRVTKKDILNYLDNKDTISPSQYVVKPVKKEQNNVKQVEVTAGPNDEIIEMNRMRKMIAERMLDSQKISAHVTSFVEADVTNIVFWRNRMKVHFKEKENTLLTFTPIFIEAVIKAIKDYPLINASVSGDQLIVKKDINIGLAVALPDGNLIVPVIKNADKLNLIGLTQKVNELAKKAKKNELKPEDLSGGTFTVSNMGSFGNLMGTPILVQPQVGILALGAVVKKPAVIETPQGDTIAIRHKMFLSHSYDHRVVDGALGGMLVRRVADYLEKFDLERGA